MRPYPKFEFPESRLREWRNKYGFLARQAVEHIGSGKQNWEFDDAALKFLANTLAHADIVISMYSTILIEAALFGKPLIAIGFDGAKKRPYWDSAERFFEWDHLREVKELNGVWIVRSREELARAINTYLTHPEHLAEGRARIVERQSQFTDGRSGERVAKILSESLNL
jgi:CDP-glycerol glycerophosphotransferase (TagB/SpsB family)